MRVHNLNKLPRNDPLLKTYRVKGIEFIVPLYPDLDPILVRATISEYLEYCLKSRPYHEAKMCRSRTDFLMSLAMTNHRNHVQRVRKII